MVPGRVTPRLSTPPQPGDHALDEPWYQGSSFLMFVVLLLAYVASSLSLPPGPGARLQGLLTIGAVCFGLRAVTRRPRIFWVGLALSLAYAFGSAVLHAVSESADYRWDTVVVLAFHVFLLGVMARVVMRRERVTVDKILAAACVYLLMGLCFGMVFALVEWSLSGSFALSSADVDRLGASLTHYSFTTLTTVGYGDIYPVSSLARSLSDIEAVLGQLFLAVVIARLVALQITGGDAVGERAE